MVVAKAVRGGMPVRSRVRRRRIRALAFALMMTFTAGASNEKDGEATSSTNATTVATNKPNIVLLVLDDIGYADVGFHGSDFVTPNIDGLAKSGVELDRMYVMPQCSPTRAAIMTGRHSWKTGMQHFTTILPGSPAALPSTVQTLAESMKSAGYSTHAIGKWHLGNAKWENTPLGRGFDTYLGYLQGQTDYYNRSILSCGKFACLFPFNCASGFKLKNPPTCDHPDASPYGPDANGYDFWRNKGIALDHHGKYTVDDYEAEFQSIVGNRGTEPFFVYYAEQLLHIPIEAPPEPKYLERCVADGVVGGYAGTNRTILCSMAARMDDAVGNLVSTLKQAGI